MNPSSHSWCVAHTEAARVCVWWRGGARGGSDDDDDALVLSFAPSLCLNVCVGLNFLTARGGHTGEEERAK